MADAIVFGSITFERIVEYRSNTSAKDSAMTVCEPGSVDDVARYQANKHAKEGDAAFARACGEFARNDAFRSLNETIIANVGRDRDKGVMFARVRRAPRPARSASCSRAAARSTTRARRPASGGISTADATTRWSPASRATEQSRTFTSYIATG